MNAIGTRDRRAELGEYLELLHAMARELERSMGAVRENSLTTFEDSLASQEAFAERLGTLAAHLNRLGATSRPDEDGLMQQVRDASVKLEKLNQRYSALLRLSSHSVDLMLSLFTSLKGQIGEGSGIGLKHQTWSCQM